MRLRSAEEKEDKKNALEGLICIVFIFIFIRSQTTEQKSTGDMYRKLQYGCGMTPNDRNKNQKIIGVGFRGSQRDKEEEEQKQNFLSKQDRFKKYDTLYEAAESKNRIILAELQEKFDQYKVR